MNVLRNSYDVYNYHKVFTFYNRMASLDRSYPIYVADEVSKNKYFYTASLLKINLTGKFLFNTLLCRPKYL